MNRRIKKAQSKSHNQKPDSRTQKAQMDCINRYVFELKMREKWEKEFGVDPNDKGKSHFTDEEQIERYSKNLFFWLKELHNTDDVNEQMFIRSMYCGLEDKMNKTLNINIAAEVYKELEKLEKGLDN